MTLTILGAPRTKKNSLRRVMVGKFLKSIPSAQYLAWRDVAVPQMLRQWGRLPWAQPVNLRAIIYRDALRGDLLGYLDGIADALQEARVVADDKWIMGLDGCRLAKDAKHPRVELEIVPL